MQPPSTATCRTHTASPYRHLVALALACSTLLSACAHAQPCDSPYAASPQFDKDSCQFLNPPNPHAKANNGSLQIWWRSSVLAVVEQESTYRVDPPVAGLGRIAREEVDRRAERVGVPRLLVQVAIQARSPDSRTWSERIDAARTEKELSNLFEELIDQVPLGQRLLAGYNPVHTGGPMQVSVDYAETYAKNHTYPYRVVGSVRDEVFTRRSGMYFGIAHLLGYPAQYDQPIYRSPISTPVSTPVATPRSSVRWACFPARRWTLTATSLRTGAVLTNPVPPRPLFGRWRHVCA